MRTVSYQQIAEIRRDYHEMLNTFNPQRVEVLRTCTPPDLLCCIRMRVHAPTYCLSKSRKTHPERCSYLDFEIRVRKGYPRVPAVVYFRGDKILASPNVNRAGLFVRDSRHADNRLAAIVKDVIRAMIYAELYEAYEGADPCLSRELLAWQQDMQQRGRFPTEMMERYLVCPPRYVVNPPVLHPRIRRHHPVSRVQKRKKK